MATLAVGGDLFVDMLNFDYSVLFFGNPTVASSKRFVVDLGNGELVDFRGKGFTYNKHGEPTGGDLRGFAMYQDGAQVFQIAGIDVSMKAFFKVAETTTQADDLKIMSQFFAGDDLISGGELADGLVGFNGKDALYGQVGADFLKGGKGADHFVYLFTDESLVGSSDTIVDFSQTQHDRIDLSNMTTAVFVGDPGEFSGTRSEVAYTIMDQNTYVYVDADADGNADLEITIDGVFTLTESDFIL